VISTARNHDSQALRRTNPAMPPPPAWPVRSKPRPAAGAFFFRYSGVRRNQISSELFPAGPVQTVPPLALPDVDFFGDGSTRRRAEPVDPIR
jgi:hypothetical protein